MFVLWTLEGEEITIIERQWIYVMYTFFFCLTLLSLHQEFRAFKCGLGCFKIVISTTQCGEFRKYKHIKKKMKTIRNPHQVDVNTVNILVCLNRCVFRGKQAGACVCDCVWHTHTHRHTLWTVCVLTHAYLTLYVCVNAFCCS